MIRQSKVYRTIPVNTIEPIGRYSALFDKIVRPSEPIVLRNRHY